MRKFDVAVVGCGNVSRMHFSAYAARPERIRLVAACDPYPERVAQAQENYGVEQGFNALDEMIADASWDVAVVCTPTLVREEAIGRLAAAGKHIFVEKPLADTYAEARRVVEICDRAGVTLAVNQNFRYHYPFESARELIAAGRIGEVLSITHEDLLFRQDAGWRSTSERHALSVMGVHWLDGFRWMLNDEPRAITCVTHSSSAIDAAGETDAAVQLVFARGAVVSYTQSFSSLVKKTETIIIGQAGALRLTYDDLTLFTHEDVTKPILHVENPYRGANKPQATFTDLDLLLTAIEEGSQPPNSGRDNLKTVMLLDGAYRSAAEGQVVAFETGVPA